MLMTTDTSPTTDVIQNIRRSPDGQKLAAQDPWTGDWMFVFGQVDQWPANSRLSTEDVADWEPLDGVDRHRADAERNCLMIEQILDTALGREASDGTSEGLAADVALVMQQRDEALAEAASSAATVRYVTDRLTDLLLDYDKRPQNLAEAVEDIRTTVDTLAWLHAEAKHQHQHVLDRERWRRESEQVGYLEHRDELIGALGQHASLPATTLMRHIDGDVRVLREAYDTIEAELIEWRTGQRAVEASAVQWTQIQSTLDKTLAAVQQLAKHVGAAPGCTTCNGGWAVDENYQPEDYERNEPLRPEKGLIPCGFCNEGGWDAPWPPVPAGEEPRSGELPVTETTAEPVRFTHDVED